MVCTDPAMGLAYFYFDAGDQGKQTDENLLSSLVMTFTVKSGNYSVLENLHNKHNQLHKPTISELLDALRELTKGFQRAYIIIDALDECSQYDDLFRVIMGMLHWNMPHLHLLVTSRREKYIEDTILRYHPLEVILSEDLIGHDIVTYIHETMEEMRQYRKWDIVLQQEIMNKLINGSNGMSGLILFSK
jgi:hypothetical protein